MWFTSDSTSRGLFEDWAIAAARTQRLPRDLPKQSANANQDQIANGYDDRELDE